MRLDGDMYESTMEALVNLYRKLSTGGFVIVDDYGYCKNCRDAVRDYRAQHCVRRDAARRLDGRLLAAVRIAAAARRATR